MDLYLRDPDESSIFDFLALPKVGLVPAFRNKQGEHRLSASPDVE